jgi:hydrogenase maturation protease
VPTLILGIGNVLMGDEGIGPAVIQALEHRPLPPGVTCLDGGTGSFALLGPMQEADRIVMVDACNDGNAPGTTTRLEPRFSSDYPSTLTAHDIGLRDLLDAMHVLGPAPPVVLYAVSIDFPQPMRVGLGPALANAVAPLAAGVLDEATRVSRN